MYTPLLLGSAPSIFRSSLSRPPIFRLFMPSGTTLLIYCFLFFLSDTLPPLKINFERENRQVSFALPSFCIHFSSIYSENEKSRIFADIRTRKQLSRKVSICLSRPHLRISPFPLLFLLRRILPSTLAGVEKEVHDLRTDRIKWGNLARRILERI